MFLYMKEKSLCLTPKWKSRSGTVSFNKSMTYVLSAAFLAVCEVLQNKMEQEVKTSFSNFFLTGMEMSFSDVNFHVSLIVIQKSRDFFKLKVYVAEPILLFL